MYCIAPVSKKASRNQKSVSVRGKIADKYRNRIRRCKRILKGGTDETNDTGGESSSKSIYLLSRLLLDFLDERVEITTLFDTSIKLLSFIPRNLLALCMLHASLRHAVDPSKFGNRLTH